MKSMLTALLATALTACASHEVQPVAPVPTPIAVAPEPVAHIAVALPVVPVAPEALPLTHELAGRAWKFQAPATMQLASDVSDKASAMYVSETERLMVVVKDDTFDGKVEDLVMVLGPMLTNAGFEFKDIAPAQWLGHDAAVSEMAKGSLYVFNWFTVVEGQGIAFSCGGKVEDKARNQLTCKAIADSFTLIAPAHTKLKR